jgi:hypothetical protein
LLQTPVICGRGNPEAIVILGCEKSPCSKRVSH